MKKVASIYIISAAILWGCIGVFIRYLGTYQLTSVQMVGIRVLVTALLIGGMIAVSDRRKFNIRICDVWMFVGTGVLSIVFFNACYFATIQSTSLAVASIFLYTAPIFVMVFAVVLFKERITKQKIVALLFAFIGCIFVVGLGGMGEKSIGAKGVLLGLGAGIGYALYSIFSTYALRKYSPITITFYTFVFASIATLPFTLQGSLIHTFASRPYVLLVAIISGIVSSVIPYLLYTKGLEYLEATKASIMAYIEPVVATIIGIVVYHETFLWEQGLGMGCIFLALVLLSRIQK